jgi:hypothetical protein
MDELEKGSVVRKVPRSKLLLSEDRESKYKGRRALGAKRTGSSQN